MALNGYGGRILRVDLTQAHSMGPWSFFAPGRRSEAICENIPAGPGNDELYSSIQSVFQNAATITTRRSGAKAPCTG